MDTNRHLLIGQIMVDWGFITLAQLNEARRMQLLSEPETRLLLGEVLTNLGYVNKEQVEKALKDQQDKTF